ncbi:MAG: hypothetical protein SFX73_07150 [Kofleriaceae bacterium]|nr:hypothetical protein [Kofleriaceae bacterium]
MFARALLVGVLSFSSLTLVGCEKTNHENIDKWMKTQKGPGKLKKALTDEGLDPDLSAHAAANLIRMNQDPDVRAAFENMSEGRRVALISKLAPKLWDLARIEREDALPAAQQIVAKDMLIFLRKHADQAQKAQIDGYLIDWYGVMSYEARAKVGSTLGAAVMRMVGPAGGKKLVSVLNGVIAAPGQEKNKIRIGDELMLGMAASGEPDAVKYLLDVARMDRGDPTLTKRAMSALHIAYVDPKGLFDTADPAPLVANVSSLVTIAKDETMAGQPANDAIELIRMTGQANCFQPLLGMVAYPHRDTRFRYAVTYAALYCGGPKSIVEVVRALPDTGTYVREELHGAVSGEIAKMTPKAEVLTALRQLLDEKGTVAKWVAIEALGALKSVEDQAKIAALATNQDKLVGYWGDQSDKDPKDRKPDPTLGERAKEVADMLGGGAPAK